MTNPSNPQSTASKEKRTDDYIRGYIQALKDTRSNFPRGGNSSFCLARNWLHKVLDDLEKGLINA